MLRGKTTRIMPLFATQKANSYLSKRVNFSKERGTKSPAYILMDMAEGLSNVTQKTLLFFREGQAFFYC